MVAYVIWPLPLVIEAAPPSVQLLKFPVSKPPLTMLDGPFVWPLTGADEAMRNRRTIKPTRYGATLPPRLRFGATSRARRASSGGARLLTSCRRFALARRVRLAGTLAPPAAGSRRRAVAALWRAAQAEGLLALPRFVAIIFTRLEE